MSYCVSARFKNEPPSNPSRFDGQHPYPKMGFGADRKRYVNLATLPIGRREIDMPKAWRRLRKLEGNLVPTICLLADPDHSALSLFPTIEAPPTAFRYSLTQIFAENIGAGLAATKLSTWHRNLQTVESTLVSARLKGCWSAGKPLVKRPPRARRQWGSEASTCTP